MEGMANLDMASLDKVLGAIAIIILLSGMFMLFGGVKTLGNDNGKPPKK